MYTFVKKHQRKPQTHVNKVGIPKQSALKDSEQTKIPPRSKTAPNHTAAAAMQQHNGLKMVK